MKLAIFNGSPRGKNSNTKVLIDNFLEGFYSEKGHNHTCDLLIQQKRLDEFVRNFMEADIVFIAFPLYADSMPGIVKAFIERIGNFKGAEKKNPVFGSVRFS
jgi:multimeric flavodoxin WrbA